MVAGLRSDQGASRQLLLLALDQQVITLASVPLILEYEAVLTRPEHLHQSGLSTEEVNAVLNALCAVLESVALRFLWRPQLKDPADEMLLETAVNGSADFITTFNLRHFGEASTRFGICAARPSEVLRKIKGVEHEEE